MERNPNGVHCATRRNGSEMGPDTTGPDLEVVKAEKVGSSVVWKVPLSAFKRRRSRFSTRSPSRDTDWFCRRGRLNLIPPCGVFADGLVVDWRQYGRFIRGEYRLARVIV